MCGSGWTCGGGVGMKQGRATLNIVPLDEALLLAAARRQLPPQPPIWGGGGGFRLAIANDLRLGSDEEAWGGLARWWASSSTCLSSWNRQGAHMHRQQISAPSLAYYLCEGIDGCVCLSFCEQLAFLVQTTGSLAIKAHTRAIKTVAVWRFWQGAPQRAKIDSDSPGRATCVFFI